MAISSRRNETVKAIRRLRRRQGERALLEGPHLLAAALDAGLRIETVAATPQWLATASGRDLAARLGRPPLEVEADLLASLADADAPRGVIAVAEPPTTLLEAPPAAAAGLHVWLDGAQDPGNVGAVARVAEAFGVATLLLAPGSASPLHSRALRASAGSLLRLPVLAGADPEGVATALDGATWVGLDAHRGEPIDPAGLPGGPIVLVLGGEAAGISPRVDALLGRRWTIPLAPPVESLNLAVAAGIVLHALETGR